jgi:hypothetical protein
MSGIHARARTLARSATVAIALLGGCGRQVTDPGSARADASRLDANAGPVGEATASVRWSTITRDFIAGKPTETKPNPVAAFRAFAYLSLAQYRAVLAADDVRGPHDPVSLQGAVAAASSVVLGALFPTDAAFFQSELERQEGESAEGHGPPNAFLSGEAVGRAVGAEVVALARSDRFDAVWTGQVPTGKGLWTSDFNPPRPPQLPLLGQMRPFFMTSGDEFRPPPPPDVDSPEFLDALAEVRRLSDTRTPDQLQIALKWAMTTGSLVSGFWNEQATNRITRYALNERRASRVLALMHMAAMDATIACYDAKYSYWLIRPYKADPAITVPVAKPNHPSYPSSHACSSGASGYVLGAFFPADAAELAAMADEAGESRLYAGIHYRFDKDAALGIARQVAALALRSDGRSRRDY